MCGARLFAVRVILADFASLPTLGRGGGRRKRKGEEGGRRHEATAKRARGTTGTTQGITGRAERDDAARDEGERTGYHIATSTDHLTISSANP